MSDKARITAYNAVKRVFGGAYSNLITVFDELEGVDRAFAEHIAIGTIERKVTLEYVLRDSIRRATKPELIYLLMTGVFQILYMDRVPDSAACDETVGAARELFGNRYTGFVNAVLRNICRNKESVIESINNADEYIKYSVNSELFGLIKSQYPDSYGEIFKAFFGREPIFLRINTLKTSAEQVANDIGGTVLSESTVRCDDPRSAVVGMNRGDYYVQGLASQKAVRLLGARRGQTLVDVCACPGGKSIGAAIDMNNEGRIISFDLHGNKLPLIGKSAERLGISIIETDVQDGRFAREALIGLADRVICDVPCSGIGVMGSKPEIRYKSPEDFKGIYPTQRAIIEAASKYLKVGGVMVYSTCSINKIENEEVIEDFLARNRGYSLVCEETCLPFNEEKEGFYMAKIAREF